MKDMCFLAYQNGNYKVYISKEDGTKLRYCNYQQYKPEFPESIDLKITNRCNLNCRMCHEESTPNGRHADLNDPIFDTFHAGMELAIGGGNPLEHPCLGSFLLRMKEKDIICNITVNLKHFMDNYDYIAELSRTGMVHGIGVSIPFATRSDLDHMDSIAKKINSIPNTVVHAIYGITTWETIMALAYKNVNLLILGYKSYGKGKKAYESDRMYQAAVNMIMRDTEKGLPELVKQMQDPTVENKPFRVICLDNLAFRQLQMFSDRDAVANAQYMGDDGEFTMYLDMVNRQYAVSSAEERIPIGDKQTIEELFADVRNRVKQV